MDNTPVSAEIIKKYLTQLQISDPGNASIREIVALINLVEEESKVKFVRMEMGVPGLPAAKVGVEAEIKALQSGVASVYPMMDGIKPLKYEASRFIKTFMNIDVDPASCIPTSGAMQGTFAALLVAGNVDKQKDTTLFLDPGFPVQKQQMTVMGHKYEAFDVFNFRGEKLRTKIESYLVNGNINAMVYSNPNNPSWICFTEEELQIRCHCDGRSGLLRNGFQERFIFARETTIPANSSQIHRSLRVVYLRIEDFLVCRSTRSHHGYFECVMESPV
jgi:DNA-binding transcriptional MocR family regulator